MVHTTVAPAIYRTTSQTTDAGVEKLQFAITEDLDAYKRMSPRERGPGMYDLRLDGAMVVKEPNSLPSVLLQTQGVHLSSYRAPS